ncbi:MAG TPA: PepSY domain-containing protein, partial [Burkholderiaceae bacterium]|nr:PepSY domain-containing protein [Burkholderiaceae bacterium]
MRTRRLFFSWLHRWVALTFGVWIALQGLTGATLVWHFELDAWLNPTWFSASRQGCTLPDQPISRALHVFEQATGGARPSMVIAPETPGAPFIVRQQLPSGMHRQHFIDAACAQYLGSRDWGAPHADRPHLIPALYEIHRSLLGGDGGRGLVGIAGLALLGLLVSGVWLAWPRCQGAARGWHAVLSVKRNGSLQRRCFDLHRASGLWLLPFLLLMCITGAYLCFPQPSRAL